MGSFGLKIKQDPVGLTKHEIFFYSRVFYNMLTFIVNLQKGLNVCVCHKLSECRLQLLHKIIRRLKWVYFGSQLSSAALTATLCWHILCIMVQKH